MIYLGFYHMHLFYESKNIILRGLQLQIVKGSNQKRVTNSQTSKKVITRVPNEIENSNMHND